MRYGSQISHWLITSQLLGVVELTSQGLKFLWLLDNIPSWLNTGNKRWRSWRQGQSGNIWVFKKHVYFGYWNSFYSVYSTRIEIFETQLFRFLASQWLPINKHIKLFMYISLSMYIMLWPNINYQYF